MQFSKTSLATPRSRVNGLGAAKSGTAKSAAKKTSASGSAKKKEAPASEGIGKAVGTHMKKAGGMFSAFKEEYDKARHDDKNKRIRHGQLRDPHRR